MGGLGTLLGTYHFQRISVPEAVASFLSFPWLRNTSISVCVCGSGGGGGQWGVEWGVAFPRKGVGGGPAPREWSELGGSWPLKRNHTGEVT